MFGSRTRDSSRAFGSRARAEEDCGCAPTAGELRDLASGRGRLLSRRSALGIGALGLVALGAVGGGVAGTGTFAFADDGYPTWDDVQQAKGNEQAKASEISRIEGLISSLQQRVAETEAVARRRAEEFAAAEQAFWDEADRAESLQSQADEQARIAEETSEKAARVAAQLYRNGGDDTALELFFTGSAAGADDLLDRLGRMDKVLERNNDIHTQAATARDAAQSLSDQAVVARNERDRLKREAESAMAAAQQASIAAQQALVDQQENMVRLEAQLAALKDNTATTVAKYEEGVRERERQRLEAEKRAREEAERLAREAEAQRQAEQAAWEEEQRRRQEEQNNGGGGGDSGGGGGDSDGGAPNPGGGQPAAGSGWARPSSGWRTDPYGPRDPVCANGSCTSGFHKGTDLATGCGGAIYAASAGTVIFAGYYSSDFGYHVRIDHGGGVVTTYSHIQPGGVHVWVGQWVNAGEFIASEGATGLAQGCHLHFEVHINGYHTNPHDFMWARGISV